jgi:hypothetical protein
MSEILRQLFLYCPSYCDVMCLFYVQVAKATNAETFLLAIQPLFQWAEDNGLEDMPNMTLSNQKSLVERITRQLVLYRQVSHPKPIFTNNSNLFNLIYLVLLMVSATIYLSKQKL